MGKKQSEAQKYVSLAKQRLISKDYSEYDKSGAFHYYVNNRKLSKEDIDRLNEIILSIMASDTLVYDALDRLIVDKEAFLSLNEIEREKYIFDLSKIYATLKRQSEL